MPITDATMRQVLSMRVAVSRSVDQVTRDLARQWGVAWQEIVDEFQAAAAELIDMMDDGRWPSRTKVLRAQHAANAIKAATEAMSELADLVGVRVSADLPGILNFTEHWSELIVDTQLPDEFDYSWARVSKRELNAIVTRTTQQIHASSRPLTKIMQDRMKAVLIRGVAVGDHPDRAAREIVNRCEGAFNGGRARAQTIARTEMLDASRHMAQESRVENRRVVSGWRWHCDLSPRTCPSCLSQNGSMHSADELGPLDHQNGRCTAVPVTKTYRELGIDVDEPADAFPDARAWFAEQPEAVQREIMGPARLDLFNRGEIGWDDMSARRTTAGWRDSFGVAPLPAH